MDRVPKDVAAINRAIKSFLDTMDEKGRKIGNAKCGVYAFFDYDEEPIYVGQTQESLRTRVRRHLTNQRTDAVAMNVLDPFEVAFVEVWPLWFLASASKVERDRVLNEAEFTVFENVLAKSTLGEVLNEKSISASDKIVLPPSFRCRIIPDDVYSIRNHADIRIARRASTIARLAQVISERDVSMGLRKTLRTQARRLQKLSEDRYAEFIQTGAEVPEESAGEETGD